jgi:hypothetical protein
MRGKKLSLHQFMIEMSRSYYDEKFEYSLTLSERHHVVERFRHDSKRLKL